MRSGAVAWLLRLHGIAVCVLGGGYKTFRAWALGTWGDIAMPVPKAKQKLKKKQAKPRSPHNRSPADAASRGADAESPDAAPAAATAAAAAAAAEEEEEEEGEASSGGLRASLVEAARAVPGRRVCVVGGRTGVGKTRVLMALREMGARWLGL